MDWLPRVQSVLSYALGLLRNRPARPSMTPDYKQTGTDCPHPIAAPNGIQACARGSDANPGLQRHGTDVPDGEAVAYVGGWGWG